MQARQFHMYICMFAQTHWERKQGKRTERFEQKKRCQLKLRNIELVLNSLSDIQLISKQIYIIFPKKMSFQSRKQTLYRDTINAIQTRAAFFASSITVNETYLCDNEEGINSVSLLLPNFPSYHPQESFTSPQLRFLYYPSEKVEEEIEENEKPILPEPSSGEQSINQESATFKPTQKWIESKLIDSSRLKVDLIRPRKMYDSAPQGWNGIRQLLLFNLQCLLWSPADKQEMKSRLKIILRRYQVSKIKKKIFLYYMGKPSMLIKFKDDLGAAFTYYHHHTNKEVYQKYFGAQIELYRVVKNRLKIKKTQNWSGLVLRGLPPSTTVPSLRHLLQRNGVVPEWIEEFVEIHHLKYTLCRIKYLQEAIQAYKILRQKYELKGLKVSLHKESSKVWQNVEFE